MCCESDADRWPMPYYDKGDEPHFLFVITPPYSGSTALANFLNTGASTAFLEKNAEGQWLVPGLCEPDRWQFEKPVDFRSVRAVWLNQYQKIKSEMNAGLAVVIEKSPPNMMRMEELGAQFNDVSFLATNRNPFANCASVLFRQHDPKKLTAEGRCAVVRDLARHWLMRSRVVRRLTEVLDAPFVSYEQFCTDPSSVLSSLKLATDQLKEIQPNPTIKVKDYKPQRIVNQNPRQINRLTSSEKAEIENVLQEDEELLLYFGYAIPDER